MPGIDAIIIILIVIATALGLTLVALLVENSLRKRLPPVDAAARRSEAAHAPEPLAIEQSAVAEPPLQPVTAETKPAKAISPVVEPAVEKGPERERDEPEAKTESATHAALPAMEMPPALEPKPTSEQQPAETQIEASPPAGLAATASSPAPIAAARPDLGLRKTRQNFLTRLRAVLAGSAKLDEICEGLEEALISADVGVNASLKLGESVRSQIKGKVSPEAVRDVLKTEIERLLEQVARPEIDPSVSPLVILLVGVNGVGKTTTVAKLAARLKAERGSVIVAAADTFRAAAIEQLEVWCSRAGVELIKHKHGSDPAAVAFDAVRAAIARKARAVIIDTAGRLQTKTNLMEELKKISRVVNRELPGAPHETWLVLDATTGQNALSQAKIFDETVGLTGVVLAKLDSTAKGGVVVGIAEQLKLPVRFVGTGEKIEDLQAFDRTEFVQALFVAEEDGGTNASPSYAA